MNAAPLEGRADVRSAPSSALKLSVVCAVVVAVGLRALQIAQPQFLTSLSDDTYIALDVARALGATGRLSTSGVQPLFVYAVAPVFALFRPDTVAGLDAAVRAGAAVGAAVDVVTLLLLARLLLRVGGPVAAGVGAWIWAVHPGAVAFATDGLETSMALAMLCAIVSFEALGKPTPRRDLALGALVAVGMLARVDLASLGLAALVASAWDRRGDPDAVRALAARAARLAAGFAAVYLPWIVALRAQTGDAFPVSGPAVAYLGYVNEMKGFPSWAAFAASGVRESATPLSTWAPAVALLAVAGLPLARGLSRFRLALFHAAAVYAFYTFYVAAWWNLWRYLAPVLVVEVVVVSLACARLCDRVPRAAAPTRLAVVLTAVAAFAVAFPVRYSALDFRHEAVVVRPAVAPGEVVGAWESGALSYYLTGATVVNLDGVADSRAYRAIRSSRLDEYMRERGVATFVGRQFGVDFVKAHARGETRFVERPGLDLNSFRVYAFASTP